MPFSYTLSGIPHTVADIFSTCQFQSFGYFATNATYSSDCLVITFARSYIAALGAATPSLSSVSMTSFEFCLSISSEASQSGLCGVTHISVFANVTADRAISAVIISFLIVFTSLSDSCWRFIQGDIIFQSLMFDLLICFPLYMSIISLVDNFVNRFVVHCFITFLIGYHLL